MPEPKTILLVEDEALIALHEKMVLEQAGYRVLHARSGEQAVASIHDWQAPVDLILMDIDLGPGIDGTQAARQILAMRDIPIIFLSMHTEPEWVEKTEQITSYGYIVKDSRPTVLLASIKMAFRLHQAHTSLRESEDRYRTLVETSTDSIAIHCEGIVVYANPAAARLHKAAGPDVLLGRSAIEFVHPEHRAAVLERLKNSYEKKQIQPAQEERFVALDGSEIEVEVTGIPISYHGKPATQVIARDISRRKRAEQELRESEARLRQILEQMPYPIEICDPAGTAKTVNQAFLSMFGIASAELVIGRYNVFTDPIVNDVLGLGDAIRRVYGGEAVFLPEVTLPLAQVGAQYGASRVGEKVLEITMFPVFLSSGEIWRVVTIWKDVSERRRAEQESQSLLVQVTHARDEAARTRDLLDALMERVSDGLVAFDQDFNYIYVNSYGAQMLGRTKEDLTGKNYWVEYPEARGTPFANAYVRAFETQQPVVLEEYYTFWDRWFSNRIYPSQEGITILFNDTTERKRAEESLRQGQARLNAMFQAIPDLIFRLDRQGVLLDYKADVNDLYIQDEEIRGKPIGAVLPPALAAQIEQAIEQTLTSGALQTFEYQLQLQGRGLHGYEARMVVSGPNEVTTIVRDITEQKRAIDALRESEERFRVIFESAPDAIFLADAETGQIVDANDAACRMTGKPRAALVGLNQVDLHPVRSEISSRDSFRKHAEEARTLDTVRPIETLVLGAGGEQVPVEVLAHLVHLDDRPVLMGTFRDVTERKRAEDQIKQLLREKELLLREVHHRVKNNMSTIIGVLSIEASMDPSPASQMVFKDASSRIQSMMVLYDKLYQSVDPRSISLRDYVPALLREVVSLFPYGGLVQIETQVAEIVLTPQKMTPLGIVLAELATNSMKYAFPDRRGGTIQVEACRVGDQVRIIYRDSGVGLPEAFDMKRSGGFGLHLVEMLLQQMDGTITLGRQGGACFELLFPL